MARELERFQPRSRSPVSGRCVLAVSRLGSGQLCHQVKPKEGSTMKTQPPSNGCRILLANIAAILAFGILSCTVPAQVASESGSFHRYQLSQEGDTSWLSRRRWELALAWTFSPSRFRDLWHRYGYPYHEFRQLCDLEHLQRYDIGSGALVAALGSDGGYIGIPLAGDTRSNVESFISSVTDSMSTDATQSSVAGQVPNDGRGQEGEGERDVVRMREVCSILPPPSQSTDNLVVVTQHHVPVPDSPATLRLTEVNTTSR